MMQLKEKKYRFITIKQSYRALDEGRTEFYIANNKKTDILGHIEYYPKWKQYVCQFNERAVFNQECLENIIDFLRDI